jgi:hypothetical protein
VARYEDALLPVGQDVGAPRAGAPRGDPCASWFAMRYQPAEETHDGGNGGASGRPPTS